MAATEQPGAYPSGTAAQVQESACSGDGLQPELKLAEIVFRWYRQRREFLPIQATSGICHGVESRNVVQTKRPRWDAITNAGSFENANDNPNVETLTAYDSMAFLKSGRQLGGEIL